MTKVDQVTARTWKEQARRKNKQVNELEAQINRIARIAENAESNLGKMEEKLASFEGSLQRAERRVKEITTEGNHNAMFLDVTTIATPRRMTELS